MRTIAAFAVFVIISPLLYTQQTRSYSFGTAVQFGVLAGQAEEIVYSDPAYYPQRTSDDKLSQLLWDMKPVFYYGFTLDYAPTDPFAKIGFLADLSLKFAIPNQKSGKIEDRDWMSQQDKSFQTHFSRHDNVTKEFFDITLKTGASFPFHANWLVSAYAAIAYTHFAFSGSKGYGRYQDYDGTPAPYPYLTFPGTVITYTQEWFTVAPGFSVKSRFLSIFSAEAFFQISPLVFCTGQDEHTYYHPVDKHVFQRTEFMDVMNGGLDIKTGLTLSWEARRWLVFSLEGSYQNIKGTRGDSYKRNGGDKKYIQEGEGGAGLSLFDSRIIVKVRF